MRSSTPKLNGKRMNGAPKGQVETPLTGPIEPPRTGPVFDAENIELQRRMRFNPLRALDPANLSIALDQFDLGILRQAALLWDAMARRDDTLSFVKPQLEASISAKPWGVFKKKNADETESARHAAALEYFYANVTATDAFDRNVKGGRHLLLKQMGAAVSYLYAVHHFIWKREPGKMIEVDGAAPVPALSAELEYVPLWFFENVSGTLRFLPFGGFGIKGQELDWESEWMVTTGAGIMFAASICYVFKRLTFQDWTIFNERYGQSKVCGQTTARKDEEKGRAFASVCENFNGDEAIIFYETTPTDKPPIQLIGPEGSVSVELFQAFLDRQDRKLTVMYRGSDLRNMSREKETVGVSAQSDETEAMEIAHCAHIADSCGKIDRMVIRFCFGEGVEPLAYFGLPDMDKEDAADLRESAGFLADRGALVELDTVAERLGVTLTEDESEALRAISTSPNPDGGDQKPDGRPGGGTTANAREFKRDAFGRFAPQPFTTDEKAAIEDDATGIMDEGGDHPQIEELLDTISENEHWRKKWGPAIDAHQSGDTVPPEKLLPLQRARDRETAALATLQEIVGIRRRAEVAARYPRPKRSLNAAELGVPASAGAGDPAKAGTPNAQERRLRELVEQALRTHNKK